MRSARFLGQMLAVCVPGLAVASFALPSRAYAPPSTAVKVEELSLQHREGAHRAASVTWPQFTEVRLAVQRAYANADADVSQAELLRAELSSRYGASLSEQSAPMGYSLEWDPERQCWVLVCTYVSTFVVDFGDLGHVTVEARDRMILN